MEKAKKRTKTSEILRHLMRYGSITEPVARNKYHTSRLGSIIYNLRKQGYEIITVMCEGRDEFGKNRFAKYTLIRKAYMRSGREK